MREIEQSEMQELVDQGYGICNFMGGVSRKPGKGDILLVEDKVYLFEEDELDSEEYQKIFDKQNEEGLEVARRLGYIWIGFWNHVQIKNWN